MDMRIYSSGICSASVCVPKEATKSQIEEFVNKELPTGISSVWKISSNRTFRSGSPMPGVCENNPDRMHYLLNC